ncbi:MAG: flagellar FliJ family protein [Deltaproteobacteria bacterium]|nr:flagellar FliJ family protein [Deltaproteobacteria bacterium]
MFKFSLEAVLKHRKIRETNAARALAEVTARLRLIEDKLRSLQQLQQDEEALSQVALNKGVLVAEMELYRFREVKLIHEVAELARQAEEAERERSHKEKALLECIKDRRLLERVREEHFLIYKEENEKLERRELDEIAIVRAARLEK